jgi:hypothetical protein
MRNAAELCLVGQLRPSLMRLRHVYLGLCVLGVIVPYSQFIPWLMQHGLDMDLFMRELFATRIGAFFAFDVVVSALALFVFVFTERTATRVRHVWLPVVATLVVGVSLGLPLFLYMRQRCLDASNV